MGLTGTSLRQVQPPPGPITAWPETHSFCFPVISLMLQASTLMKTALRTTPTEAREHSNGRDGSDKIKSRAGRCRQLSCRLFLASSHAPRNYCRVWTAFLNVVAPPLMAGIALRSRQKSTCASHTSQSIAWQSWKIRSAGLDHVLHTQLAAIHSPSVALSPRVCPLRHAQRRSDIVTPYSAP